MDNLGESIYTYINSRDNRYNLKASSYVGKDQIKFQPTWIFFRVFKLVSCLNNLYLILDVLGALTSYKDGIEV